MKWTGDHRDVPLVPASVVLRELLGEAPADRMTLGWLVGRLGERSFGAVLLLLGVLGLLPGVSVLAGLLLVVPAFQMVRAQKAPIFARRLGSLGFATRRMAGMIRRTAPVLHYLERYIRPRWPTPFEATKQAVGAVVLLLGLSMLVPIPLSNVPPAIMVILIAFAYLEEDGALLAAALGASVILLVILAAVVRRSVGLAHELPGLR